MTGGMAYEALNNLGHSQRRVIIVLNDNGRSYAPTVSNLTAYDPRRRRAGPARPDQPHRRPPVARAHRRSASTRRTCAASAGSRSCCATCPSSARRPRRRSRRSRPAVREVLQPPSFFEALGVRYVGPVDGHDIPALEQALRNAVELSSDGPIVVHVITQKGRGYPPAEDDDEKHLHDAPVFDPLIGPPKAVPTGYTQAFAEAIIKEAEADERIVAITAAMAGPTGLLPFQAALPRPLLRRRHRRAARRHGCRRDGDGRAAARRGDLLDVPQPGVGPGRLRRRACTACRSCSASTGPASPGPDGASHHGVYDMALLARVPGMRVLAPSSAQELHQMLHDAMSLADGGPVAIRYPRGQARQVGEHDVGVGIRARRIRVRRRPGRGPGLRAGDRQARRGRREGGRCARRRGHRRHGVGRPLLRPARRGHARRRRRATAPS